MQSPKILSFAWLDKRLRDIPDGPAGYLNTPPWLIVWAVIGMAGIVIGLLPVLLVKLLTPAMWMVDMARAGVWISIVGLAPWVVRSIWVMARGFWQWRIEFAEQMDHDLAQERTLIDELSLLSEETLASHLKFSRDGQARMAAKFSFLFGSIDKLGMLPVLIAVALQLKALGDVTAMPGWQALLGIGFAIQYMISINVSLTRLRLQSYESLLAEALDRQKKVKGGGGS